MDTSNKSLTSLLEKMVAADTDYRFMAMNDLINELQVNTLRLDLQSEKRVVGLILRLLRDPSGEVQSLAVKSLGPLATKVKEQQIITIVKDLVGTMEKGGEGQLRSICSIGLKTVVNALPNATDMVVVQSAVREAISPLLHMVMSHQDDNVRVEACEVLAEIINHFGNLLTSYHLDLLDCMITCLGCPQTTLRKRAIQALGYLSWIIPQKYFSSLVSFLLFRLQMSPFLTSKPMEKFDDHLSKLITENTLFQRPHLLEQLKQVPSVDVMKTLLQCFNVVSRQLQRSPHCIPSVLQLLISIAYSSNTNNPEQDDIVELVIQVLETIIRRCPRAISPSLPELINLLCERLQYDPNYDYGLVEDGDDQMGVNNNDVDFEDDNADVDADDDDDEDGEYSDDEDVSWKVRRAAARALEAIILVFTEMTANFYVSIAPLLIKQFNEREESVRLSIFSCLSALLRQTRLTSTIHLNTTITNGSVAVNQQNSPRSYESTLFVSESTLEELKLHLQDPNSAQSRLLSLLPTLYRGIEKQTSQSISNKMKSQNANRVLGHKKHHHKEWITVDTLDKILERRNKKAAINTSRTRAEKAKAQAEYTEINKQVKRSIRTEKRKYVEDLAMTAEKAAREGNMQQLYDTTKKLSGNRRKPERPVKSKEGEVITNIEERQNRWVEHFKELLNRPAPLNPPSIEAAPTDLPINVGPPKIEEISMATRQIKSGKVAGPDNIPAEALKADVAATARILHILFNKIWDEEQVPKDWKEGLLIKIPKKGDLINCDNYRGITLLSIPGKVFNWVFDPNTNHTAKMEMINVLVLLLSTHPASYFESKLDLLVQLTVQSINNSFYRVALEGLDLLQLLCTHLKSLGGEKYAQVLFTPLFNQLKATDRDLELKEKAITVT
ncbi:unnamed protein product [Schistosoma curassoni]|uniref:TIP120 domain-containing protein n=1 Tax=Schistosoma curassoni TaxID=6186 RepID=A0A183K1G5_9TREM|nr:unnamed protein product [Schistosoma curassoni]